MQIILIYRILAAVIYRKGIRQSDYPISANH